MLLLRACARRERRGGGWAPGAAPENGEASRCLLLALPAELSGLAALSAFLPLRRENMLSRASQMAPCKAR